MYDSTVAPAEASMYRNAGLIVPFAWTTYAPGSPCERKLFGIGRFIFALVSMNAFSSKIACGSCISCFNGLLVLLKRQAKLFVCVEATAAFIAFWEATRCGDDFQAVANCEAAEGVTLTCETCFPLNKNQTPAAQSN